MTLPRSKGDFSPFYLACAVPRRRHDLLLSCAVDSFERGDVAGALLAVENVCRSLPRAAIPAILRAKIVQTVLPARAADAWYAAWACDPEQIALQDMLLRVLLAQDARANAIALGLACLPERCREGSHATLVALLGAAGLTRCGACWKDGDRIAAMLFAPAATPRLRVRVQDEHGAADYEAPADGRRFHLPVARAGGVWSLTLASGSASASASEQEKVLLAGSPLSFETAPAPDGAAPVFDAASAARRPIAIVLPVYRGLAQVRACVDSVLASLPANRAAARLLVVDDAGPEPALSTWLATLADAGRLTLLRNPVNLGFIGAVNRGLRACLDADALLLNADTLVHGDWIDRLAAALYGAPDIAAVSPWSNNGEITSYPTVGAAAPMPSLATLARIDTTAAQLRRDGGADIELPACCGFAMLMRRTVIDRIGVLDGNALRRGYGEEVDWCLRARAAGYRLLAATGVYVAHAGGVSFRREKALRVRQNRAVLGARYPGYFDAYQRFLRHDPLAAPRARLAAALAAAGIDAPAHAPPPRPPAPLPQAGMRIGVWRHRVDSAYAPQILRLARLLASRAAQRASPPLRMLLLGEAPDALWHTGVVDVLPDQSDADALFDDATLLGLAGCVVLLAAPGDAVPHGVPIVRLDAGFDAAAWLAAWLAAWSTTRSPLPEEALAP